MAKTKMICSVENCSRPVIAKELCSAHWQRRKKHGDVLANIPIGKVYNGHRNPNWKGGEVVMPDGRVLIYAPDHPNVGVAGVYVLRYRLVMEEHLGRYLTEDEIVHHKNEDVTDDRIENLEVMSQGNHAKHHDSLQTSDAEMQRIRGKRGGRAKARKRNSDETFST